MKLIKAKTALVTQCCEALRLFWDEQLAAESTRTGGAILALPLMYPDGLQVLIRVEPLSETSVVVSDQGETLSRFFHSDFNYQGRAKQTQSLLEERTKAFELLRDGLELKKQIKLPIEGIDLHLFGEALVSISHLIYRHEAESPPVTVAERTVKEVFQERRLQPRLNAPLDGEVEKAIHVDFLLEAPRPLALQVVKRRGPILSYMEQWGFRWSDLRKHNHTLLRAMVYDPDLQDWDQNALRIGGAVCEFFCPYFETKLLHQAIDQATRGSR